ncbi:MAG: hypothetical protein WCP97_04205 [bacterium]
MHPKRILLFFVLALGAVSFGFAQDALPRLQQSQPLYVTLQQPFIANQAIESGSIVSIVEQTPEATPSALVIAKTDIMYDPHVLGVTVDDLSTGSTEPKVAISGEVSVLVDLGEDTISKGDFITSSSLPGVAIKAKRAGYIIGKALEDLTLAPTTPTTGDKPAQKLKILLSPTWLDGSFFTLQNSLSKSDLEAQDSLKVGNGAMKVDKSGNLSLTGSLISTGNITSTGESTLMSLYVTEDFTTDTINAPAFSNISAKLGDNLGASRFDVLDNKGVLQSSIDSDGNLKANSGTFSSLSIKESGETIGKASLVSGSTQVYIPNHKVHAGSYIFITPKDSTAGQVAFVTRQEEGKGFAISIDVPLSKDVEFNWWIVD